MADTIVWERDIYIYGYQSEAGEILILDLNAMNRWNDNILYVNVRMYDMPKQKDQSANAWIYKTRMKESQDRQKSRSSKTAERNRPNGMRVNSNKNKRTLLFEYNISFRSVFGAFASQTNQMKFLLHIRVYVWHKQSAHIRIEYRSIVCSTSPSSSLLLLLLRFCHPRSIEMKCADSLSTCTTLGSCSYCDSVCLTFRIRYLCGLLCMLKLTSYNRERER